MDRAAKAEPLLAIGAEAFVDFEATDVRCFAERYDVILDIASTRPFSDWRQLLRPDGTYVVVGHDHFGSGEAPCWAASRGSSGCPSAVWSTPSSPGSAAPGAAPRGSATCSTWSRTDSVVPVVARTFPLEEAAEALEYLMTEQATGRVAIEVRPEGR